MLFFCSIVGTLKGNCTILRYCKISFVCKAIFNQVHFLTFFFFKTTYGIALLYITPKLK